MRLKTDGCALVRRRVIQRLRSVHPIGPPIARIARHTNGIRGTCDVRHSCRYHDTGQEVNARPTVAQFWHARGRSNPRLRHDGPEFCQKNQHPIQLFRCSNEPTRPRVPWAPFVFPPPRPDPPPQFGGLAEPSGANGDADAAAICEAATQPMRFVSVETAISWFFIGRSLFRFFVVYRGLRSCPSHGKRTARRVYCSSRSSSSAFKPSIDAPSWQPAPGWPDRCHARPRSS